MIIYIIDIIKNTTMVQKSKSPEINLFKWKKEEVLNWLEKKWYDKEKIQNRLNKIKKLEEKDKEKLDKVKAGSEKHIELIKQILEKKEEEQKSIIEQTKNKADKVREDVENKIEKKVEEIKDKARNTILEKTGIWAIMEKVTWMFDKFTGIFDTLWKKITAAFAGTALWAFFGFKKEEDKEKPAVVENEEDMSTEKKLEQLEKEWKVETKPETKEVKNKPLVSAKTKKEVQYISWIKTLLSLTWIKTETNVDKKWILDRIKYLKYNYLINLEDSEKDQFLWWDKKETFNKILEQFKSNKFKTLANYQFKWKFLEKIIKDDNWEINEKLAEKIEWWKTRLQEILNYNKDNSEWWRDTLTVEEISLLYSSSFNILSIPRIKGAKFKEKLWWYLFDKNNTISETENNFVSKNIISWFAILWADFGSKDYLKKDNDVKHKVWTNLNNEEKEQLYKIIEFKDYILWDYLTEFEPKLDETQKELFKNNLDYKWIITLYSLLKAKDFDKDISIINKLSLVFLNSKIIWWTEGSKYIWKIIYDWYKDGSIFTEEEEKVLWIYKDKFVDIMIYQNLNEIWKKLWFASWLTDTDLDTLAMWLWWGGAFAYILWNKIIKKKLEKWGISMLWVFAKKLGFIWMIWGAIVWGYSFYNKDHLKSTIWDDLKKSENKPNEILKILKEYQNSIFNETIVWKNIQIITYKKDTPLVLMDWKVFTFDFIDTPILEKIKNIDWNEESLKSIWKSALRTIFSILPDSEEIKVNWNKINRTKIKIEWWNINFWENISYNLSELFKWIVSKKIQIDKNTINSINQFLKDNVEKKLPFSWKDVYYYPLKKLDNWKILSLVQIGEKNQKNWK